MGLVGWLLGVFPQLEKPEILTARRLPIAGLAFAESQLNECWPTRTALGV